VQNFKYEWIGAIGSLWVFFCPVIVNARPLVLTPEQASALSGDSIVKVKPGGSLAISFLNSSERIYKVWFAKSSNIQVEGDVPLCSSSSCSAGGASILYLRIPGGANLNGQMVTITTIDGDRRNLYNFKLVPSSNPYTLVAIAPSMARVSNNISKPTVFLIPRLERGLSKAKAMNWVEPELESQIRKFIEIYTGQNLQEALQATDLSLETLKKLESLAAS
jgi:hypothetical protein